MSGHRILYPKPRSAGKDSPSLKRRIPLTQLVSIRWQNHPTAWHTTLRSPIEPVERCSNPSPGQTHIINGIDHISARSSSKGTVSGVPNVLSGMSPWLKLVWCYVTDVGPDMRYRKRMGCRSRTLLIGTMAGMTLLRRRY